MRQKFVRSMVLILMLVGISATLLTSQSNGNSAIPIATPPTQCKDPWVTQAIQELVGRDPRGTATIGECDINRYGHGHWSDYNDLKNKVREGFFNHSDESRIHAERCFGGVGPKCEGLPAGLSKHVNGNGTVTLFASVGSIIMTTAASLIPRARCATATTTTTVVAA